MKYPVALALAGAIVLVGCGDGSESTDTNPLAPSLGAAAVMVTSNADAGAGSLRAALAAAEQDPSITRIQLSPGLGTVTLAAPLGYTGPQALTLEGSGTTLDASGLIAGTLTAFLVDGAAGFAVQDLGIVSSPGTALTIKVPAAATGTFAVELTRFTAKDSQLHGVLINDQAHYFEDPETDSQDGSDAALRIRVTASRFDGNGFGAADQDGLRVNEGGAGTLDFAAQGTVFVDNGADGLELDERGPGDAVFTVQQSTLLGNGTKVNDPIDFDDGMDVDEFADGSLIGRVVQVTATENSEEGFDLNENDAGDLRIEMDQVEASGNAEEGVDLEEDDDFIGGGDLIADLRNVTTLRNGSSDGDAGLKLRERGDGSIVSRIVQAIASDNLIDGIQIREQDGGSVDAQIVSSTASGNDGNGVRVRGEGVVELQSLTATGNGDLDLTADAGITLTQVGSAVP